MTDLQQIRWQQRFENFERTFKKYQQFAAEKDAPKEMREVAMADMFLLVFELSWKVLKDLLSAEGIETETPRHVLKTAFQYNYIIDGAVWIDMLKDRNLLAHTCDEDKFSEAFERMEKIYVPLICQLREKLLLKL